MAGILTPGQHGDCPQFIPLLEAVRIARRGQGRPRTRPGRAMADKAYSSAANRAYLRKRRITAVIPVKEDQKKHRRNRSRAGGRPPAFDARRYKERNTAERCFSELRQFRAVATRHGKRDYMDQATAGVASIRIWLRDPVADPRELEMNVGEAGRRAFPRPRLAAQMPRRAGIWPAATASSSRW